MSYDIIGDIHGCAGTLVALLEKLGYQERGGVYRHASRKVIFLGDFVDGEPHQREVVDLARAMVASDAALAVMGNHEFNAIAYATPGNTANSFLRAHSDKNRKQHEAFLTAYAGSDAEQADAIAWFKTLPLWLDLGPLRVVHACWDPNWIARLTEYLDGSNQLTDRLLVEGTKPESWQFQAIETLLKGKEIPLREGYSFRDKYGHERHHIRIRWWDRHARTYQQAFLGSESARTHIPDDPIHGDHLVEYSHDAPPVFLGHYWMEGEPAPLAENIACLDYSVARRGGKLAAYRWDGETTLSAEKYVTVDRLEA